MEDRWSQCRRVPMRSIGHKCAHAFCRTLSLFDSPRRQCVHSVEGLSCSCVCAVQTGSQLCACPEVLHTRVRLQKEDAAPQLASMLSTPRLVSVATVYALRAPRL